MKEKFAKLIDVKSIVTLVLTAVFCALALCGTITGGEFLGIFTTVIAFYFGTQAAKTRAAEAAEAQTPQKPEASVGTVEDTPAMAPECIDCATYEKMHPVGFAPEDE